MHTLVDKLFCYIKLRTCDMYALYAIPAVRQPCCNLLGVRIGCLLWFWRLRIQARSVSRPAAQFCCCRTYASKIINMNVWLHTPSTTENACHCHQLEQQRHVLFQTGQCSQGQLSVGKVHEKRREDLPGRTVGDSKCPLLPDQWCPMVNVGSIRM